MAKILVISILAASVGAAAGAGHMTEDASLGPRPTYLVNVMKDSKLKDTLEKCIADHTPMPPHDWSIGHRGACLQFPEHTAESFEAAIEMGAGIVECDVAVTKDGELVCRHAQCDLHTTTDILLHEDLAAKCSEPFAPASGDAGATARCCTSDITLEEFKTLCGKMDASDGSATTVEEYVGGTAPFRTDLYSAGCPTLVTHAESIALIDARGRKFTPELKTYTQGDGMPDYDAIREKVIDEYVQAGVAADRVWPQSFNLPDIEYWIANFPDTFGPQAVYLEGNYCHEAVDGLEPCTAQIGAVQDWYDAGVRFYAPPMWMLLKTDGAAYAASDLATSAKNAGLELITWTLERSGPLETGGGWYYRSVTPLTEDDGDMFYMLDALKDVGVVGVFSDWPATTTFYANCVMPLQRCVDDPKWHKLGETAKDCAWVSDHAPRCEVRGEGRVVAKDACACACA